MPERDFIVLGRVVGIQVRWLLRRRRVCSCILLASPHTNPLLQHDKKPLEEAKKGMTVLARPEHGTQSIKHQTPSIKPTALVFQL